MEEHVADWWPESSPPITRGYSLVDADHERYARRFAGNPIIGVAHGETYAQALARVNRTPAMKPPETSALATSEQRKDRDGCE